MSGQVWTSLDENGLAGALKGVVAWSGDLRMSVAGALHASTRITAAPMLKKQAATDEAAAQGQNLLPAIAAEEECEIVVRERYEG